MKLEVYTTNVELQDIPSYTTSITLEGQLLRLSFVWNERIGKRILSIKNSVDECYLQNTILHPNEPLTLNSNAIFDDLPYTVTLVKTGDSKRVGNIFDWSKDFILCFSRTVDLDVKKLNVVYGVTTPSTPILPTPSPTFGDWTLNQEFNIVGDNARYSGYKTNGIDTYDSFADFDLATALVRSFHDSDLQQYAAFTTAVEQLLGSVDWVLDPANNQILYTEEPDPTDPDDPTREFLWKVDGGSSLPLQLTPELACQAYTGISCISVTVSSSGKVQGCWKYDGQAQSCSPVADRVANPAYDPEAEKEEKIFPLETVAQQVISNAEASEDEFLKLLSEDYINLVANSMFDNNPSEQFVKLEDLIPQLEANKVLR